MERCQAETKHMFFGPAQAHLAELAHALPIFSSLSLFLVSQKIRLHKICRLSNFNQIKCFNRVGVTQRCFVTRTLHYKCERIIQIRIARKFKGAVQKICSCNMGEGGSRRKRDKTWQTLPMGEGGPAVFVT